MPQGAPEHARNKILDVSGRITSIPNEELPEKTRSIPLKTLPEILEGTEVTIQEKDGRTRKTTLGKMRKQK